MAEWPTRHLEEVCAEGGGFVRTGPFGSQLHKSDYVKDADGIPVVMPKNMSGGAVDLDGIARIDADTASRLSQHLFAPGDVALSRRGDVGRSAFINDEDLPAFCGTGCLRVHLGQPKSVEPQFLRYFFRSHLASNYLEAHAVGATMPNLNATIVNAMPVPIPPRESQRAIGQILSTFDDLIENNRRRAEVLEQMARVIYREWFVRFRFPGHEDAIFFDSVLGPIPRGWEVSALDAVVELRRATVCPGDVDGDTPLVGLEHIPRRQLTLDNWATARGVGSRKTRFEAGDILFGKIRPYFHKVAVAPMAGICSTDALVFDASGPHRGLAIMALSSEELVSYATQTAHGTKMPRANWDVMKAHPVILPPAEVTARFSELVEDISAMATSLMFGAKRLGAMRDQLLPKLVTGQIDVSDLDLDEALGEVRV